MAVEEIIVCSKCQGEDCRVDELREKERISMDEYAHRHTFPGDLFSRFWNQSRTLRRFIITCQDCGYQKEFQERMVENLVHEAFNVEKGVRDGS